MNHTTSFNNYQHMVSLVSPILFPNPLNLPHPPDNFKVNPRHSIISVAKAFKTLHNQIYVSEGLLIQGKRQRDQLCDFGKEVSKSPHPEATGKVWK